MSKSAEGSLMAMLKADPDGMFAIKCDLESGNQFRGVIGPIINGKICSKVEFRRDPTDEEVAQAVEALSFLMGKDAKFSRVARTKAEKEAVEKERKRWLGLQ